MKERINCFRVLVVQGMQEQQHIVYGSVLSSVSAIHGGPWDIPPWNRAMCILFYSYLTILLCSFMEKRRRLAIITHVFLTLW